MKNPAIEAGFSFLIPYVNKFVQVTQSKNLIAPC
jgi:hypothetical protein